MIRHVTFGYLISMMSSCYRIWYVDSHCQEQEQILSVAQPEMIYVHVRNVTSVFD